MKPIFERTLSINNPALQWLAPLDALLLPAMLVLCIKTLPASGGLPGALLGVLCLWIGVNRSYCALIQFKTYRWMTLRLVMFKLVWFIRGSS
jgi:hypothetical protein